MVSDLHRTKHRRLSRGPHSWFWKLWTAFLVVSLCVVVWCVAETDDYSHAFSQSHEFHWSIQEFSQQSQAFPQDPPAQESPVSDHLDLTIWETGQFSLGATFASRPSGFPSDLTQLSDALTEIVSCAEWNIVSELEPAPYRLDILYYGAECVSGVERQGLTNTLSLALAPLIQSLQALSTEQLSLSISFPDQFPKTLVEPNFASDQVHQGSRFLSQSFDLNTLGGASQEEVGTIVVQFGYYWRNLATMVGVMAGVMGSLPVMGWLGLRWMAANSRDDDGARFGCLQLRQWMQILTLVLWHGGLLLVQGWRMTSFLSGTAPPFVRSLVMYGVMIGGPICVAFASHTIFYRFLSQRNYTTLSPEDSLKVVAWTQFGIAAWFALITGVYSLANAPLQQSVGWIVFALVGAVVAQQMLAKIQNLTPHALTMGDLRDRVFELAEKAETELQQLYLLPARKVQMANAFAMQGGNVMFTDFLLERLSRREVDAIIAHELAHLQFNHIKRYFKFRWYFWLAFVFGMAIFSAFLPFEIIVPAAVIGIFLMFMRQSRRFEYEADEGSAQLTGDPEGMISALAGLTKIARFPLRWNRWMAFLYTHPSTEQRAMALAKNHEIPPERVQELLERSAPIGEGYPIPMVLNELEAEHNQPIYSTQYKQRALQLAMWSLVAGAIALPLLVAGIYHYGLVRLPRSVSFLGPIWLGVALIAVPIVVFIHSNLMPIRGQVQLRESLGQRLAAEGWPVDNAQFVGFAPSRTLQLYEGHTYWDAGFLRFEGSQLSYMGENVKFAVQLADIVECRLVKEMPGWLRLPFIQVNWRDEGGDLQHFYLGTMGDGTSLKTIRQTQRLFEQIQQWRQGNGEANGLGSFSPLAKLTPPQLGNVTSISLWKVISWSAMWRSWLTYVVPLGAVAALFCGLPFRLGLYVVAVALTINIFNSLPVLLKVSQMRMAHGGPQKLESSSEPTKS